MKKSKKQEILESFRLCALCNTRICESCPKQPPFFGFAADVEAVLNLKCGA